MAAHLTVCGTVAALGIHAVVCLAFVLLHRAVFKPDAGGPARANTLFDFVSTIGG